ncbi:MAG: hypothetical protein ACOCW6_08415, partial [Spirochaetota bacterium]
MKRPGAVAVTLVFLAAVVFLAGCVGDPEAVRPALEGVEPPELPDPEWESWERDIAYAYLRID